MPVTGLDPSRRALLAGACLLATAWHARADSADECWDVVAKMAAALGTGDAGEFLGACDPAVAGYSTLRANVQALVSQADVESAVDPLRNSGDDARRQIEADWSMRLIDRTGLGRVTPRRETVKLEFTKKGKKWRVTAIGPVAFFAPPSA